jgi:hypothetical protein
LEITDRAILEIWEHFSDFIPLGKKNDAASRFLRILIDQDIELNDLEDLREEDEHIDYALDELKNDLDGDYNDDLDYNEE